MVRTVSIYQKTPNEHVHSK